MNPSGLWRGRCESRVGHFKFITVELLPNRPTRDRRRMKISESEKDEKSVREILDCAGRPESVEELLKQIGLEVTTLQSMDLNLMACVQRLIHVRCRLLRFLQWTVALLQR